MANTFNEFQDTIIITVKGGVVTAVLFNGPATPDVVIVDHDELDEFVYDTNKEILSRAKGWKELL